MSRKSKLNGVLARLSNSSENRQKRRFRRAEWHSQGSNRPMWEPTLEFHRTKMLLDRRNAEIVELDPLTKEIHKLKKKGLLI